MNQQTKKLISKIEHQISDTSARFEMILRIFGSNSNLKTINRVAPNVFLFIRSSLFESVIICINRLCDPAVDRQKNKNLSLERLRLSLPKRSPRNRVLQQELEDLERKIKKEGERLNILRRKRMAHSDYKTHTRNWYRKIPTSAINSCLKMMEEYINKIYLHFDNCSVNILNPSYPSGDGPDRFMSLLKASVERQQIN